ncbi:MAG TPA: hypothetical protein VF742_13525 [Terracidiphilus sp.]|jgi:hypothetical protein
MSTTTWFPNSAPISRRVRAYFAPVNRTAQTPVLFDPSEQGAFNFTAPPSPWIDLGWIQSFTRKSASKIAPISTGIPSAPLEQVRESLFAQVSFEFLNWTKLTMALATGSQHMNLLAPASGAAPAAVGAQAMPAVAVQSGSTATSIALASTAGFTSGQSVAVDVDNTGQTGFVGSPVSGAYIRQTISDVDYIRRITFNVALISQVSATTLTLASPLPGGAPAAGTKAQAVTGFVDREGGSFFQEWSALFVMEGSQHERIFFYYPRLQPNSGAEESPLPLASKSKLERIALHAQFTALPVTDPLDGERILCYRSFLPAPNALV